MSTAQPLLVWRFAGCGAPGQRGARHSPNRPIVFPVAAQSDDLGRSIYCLASAIPARRGPIGWDRRVLAIENGAANHAATMGQFMQQPMHRGCIGAKGMNCPLWHTFAHFGRLRSQRIFRPKEKRTRIVRCSRWLPVSVKNIHRLLPSVLLHQSHVVQNERFRKLSRKSIHQQQRKFQTVFVL